MVAACRRFGQPPSGEAARPGFFAVGLPGGSWAVVGVAPQGADDRGRPGALAFHALIVAPRDYRRAGADPFAFAGAHRGAWDADTPATLPTVRWPVAVAVPAVLPPLDPRGRRVVAALKGRRRVALEAPGPIDDLARAVWAHLPVGVRRRASVATWAFSNENRFDLVAFPRLAGIALEPIYLAPASLDAPEPVPAPRQGRARAVNTPGAVPVAWAGMAAVVAVALAWSAGKGWFDRRPAVEPPPPEVVAEAPSSPAAAPRLRAGLDALADRFAAFDVGPSTDPATLLTRLADGLHYHGRVLTPAQRAEIARDPDPDKARALLWDDEIRRFLDDQPWPGAFATLPVEQQLHAVARSFHLDPIPPADQIPEALIRALARPGAVRPTPLAARFPPLSEYARFLGRLPRLDDRPASETDR